MTQVGSGRAPTTPVSAFAHVLPFSAHHLPAPQLSSFFANRLQISQTPQGIKLPHSHLQARTHCPHLLMGTV